MTTTTAPADARRAPLVRRLDWVAAVDAHEGPVYAADEDALYFTSLPAAGRPSLVKRLALDARAGRDRVSVVPAAVTMPNGMTLAPDGRLLVCEQGDLTHPARLSLVDRRTGATETLVDNHAGRPLSSPNDVVVRSDGTVWFTDPSYGHLQGFRPRPRLRDAVYRLDPLTGATSVLTQTPVKPNGIAFSPDESVLYVTDSGANQEPGSFHPYLPHHVVRYDVAAGRRLTDERVLATIAPGIPDGIKVDAVGRIYVSSTAGVHVLSPDGSRLALLPLPGVVNFTFGGPDGDVLYLTTDTAVWAAVLDPKGA